MKSERFDFVLTTLLLIGGAWISYSLNLPPLPGGAVLVLPASLYLLFRNKFSNLKRLGLSVLLFGFLCGFGFDFFENINGAWQVQRLVFPILFGLQPIDNLVGYGLMTLLMVLFYQRFFETDKTDLVSRRASKALVAAIGIDAVIVFAHTYNPGMLLVPYAYFVGGSVAALAVLWYCYRHSEAIAEATQVSAYFFFVWFLEEYVAVSNHGWAYPGQYIGSITFSSITFPIEELLFWMVWYGAATVVFYRMFITHKP